MRVRVVLEGEAEALVDSQGRDYYLIDSREGGITGRNAVYCEAPHVKSIEILPEPVKVGDKVRTREDYDNLPVGAIVTQYESPDIELIKTGAGWMHVPTGERYWGRPAGIPRTVKYLP